MTVAPLTATVLADADESNAGIASGVNNAIARVAGLVAIAAVGAVVAATFGSKLEDEVGAAALTRPEVARAVERGEAAAARRGGGRTACREDVAASVREAAEDASVTRLPRGPGDRDRAGGAGRRARAGRDREPAPPGEPPRTARAASSWASRARARGSRRATGTSRSPSPWRSRAAEASTRRCGKECSPVAASRSRREFLDRGVGRGASALALPSAARSRPRGRRSRRRALPKRGRSARACARRCAGAVLLPAHAGLQPGAARLQHALRRHPPAGRRAALDTRDVQAVVQLGEPLRRAHGAALGRPQLRRLLDDRRRRRRRPQPPARDPRRRTGGRPSAPARS